MASIGRRIVFCVSTLVTSVEHSRLVQNGEGPVVEAAGLELVYKTGVREVRALDGIDLTVPRGQFLCVRGKSGSGKSSLLHTIGGLRKPTAGSVRVAGLDVNSLTPREAALFRRRMCGIVFQFFNLLPMLTVAQNVAFPLILDGLPRARINGIVDGLLAELGILAYRDRSPDQLSGGEMQRVAIARAVAIDPDVILADEPTGNLDSASGAQIWELLRDLAHRKNVTTIMVTHDADAAEFADRVVELGDGRVIRDSAKSGGHGS
jgi:putative ABC transport system ATP-binding protein